MTDQRSKLDATFLARQRRRLELLRRELLDASVTERTEEASVNQELRDQAREPEEDAQRLDSLELSGHLVRSAEERLENIEHALQRLDAGTYGVSEFSGAPIDIGRLEAVPEAVLTLNEQRVQDRERHRERR
jgi:DnaK suppressor protein